MSGNRHNTFGKNLITSVIGSIFESPHLADTLSNTAQALGQAFQVSRALVVLKDQDPVEWVADSIQSMAEPASVDRAALILGELLQREALSSERSIALDSTDKGVEEGAPFLLPFQREIKLLEVKSLLAVPVFFHGNPIGALVLAQCDSFRTWTKFDCSLLQEIAFHVGLAAGQATDAPEAFARAGAGEQAEPRHFTPAVPEARRSPASKTIAESIPAKGRASPMPEISYAEMRQAEVSQAEMSQESHDRYRRLVEHSDAIIFHVDPDWTLTFVSRRALDFFGVSPEDLLGGDSPSFFDLLHPDDAPRVRSVASQISGAGVGYRGTGLGFGEECRVVNRVTGRMRWLLVRVVPVMAPEGAAATFIGWDGFGIDITERKETQEALDLQSKKVRALYTVSSAIRGYLDPAGIAARGLIALFDATGADAGACYLYTARSRDKLALVAHHGFSPESISNSRSLANLSAFATNIVKQGQSAVIGDLRVDTRARGVAGDQGLIGDVGVAGAEQMVGAETGLRSAVLVPIVAEESTLGALVLFSREVSRFDGGDMMLVSAAASQIGLAARQANLFGAYRRQAKNLSALYRLSHELSREVSLADLFQQAFGIIREELGLKRLWLGLLDESGSRIVGQAAYGPGFKRRLVEINVEIQGRDHPIARAVSTKTPIVIRSSSEILRELGVRKVFSRLGINSLAMVPLISRGQVLGVLAVQPRSDELILDEEELTLLSSLANEIGAILLTKRLEDRIQQSEKMRTTGLLAAGIAHNFNNLLQAILGQASLLEIQGKNDPQISRAVKIMTEAASRGATLVKHLLSFAHLDDPQREICNLNDLLERNYESLTRMINEGQQLEFSLTPHLPRAFADSNQIVRVINSLVRNASESILGNHSASTNGDSQQQGGLIEIITDSVVVDDKVAHFDIAPGTYLRISVRDNGVGMDEETKRRCFEPFFTTKQVDPSSGLGLTGAGLGLAAAYAIARRNGGWLGVESRVGHGAAFTLYLPVAPERALEKAPDRPRRNSLRGTFHPQPLSKSIENVADSSKAPTNGGAVRGHLVRDKDIEWHDALSGEDLSQQPPVEGDMRAHGKVADDSHSGSATNGNRTRKLTASLFPERPKGR